MPQQPTEKPEARAVVIQDPEAAALLDRARVGALVERGLAQIQATIASQSWGKKIGPEMSHALAVYCERYHLDPAVHIEVLGGRPYRKADFYLDRLAQMQETGIVEWAEPDHVSLDARLAALAKSKNEEVAQQAQDEQDRRTFMRIKYGLPDDAVAAVIYRVKLRTMDRPVVGAKAVGGDTAVKVGQGGALIKGDKADPVGAANPFTTAETRAARRCLRQIVPLLPPDQRAGFKKADDDWNELKGRWTEGEVEVLDEVRTFPQGEDFHRLGPPSETVQPGHVRVTGGPTAPSVMTEGDPYAPDAKPRKRPKPKGKKPPQEADPVQQEAPPEPEAEEVLRAQHCKECGGDIVFGFDGQIVHGDERHTCSCDGA